MRLTEEGPVLVTSWSTSSGATVRWADQGLSRAFAFVGVEGELYLSGTCGPCPGRSSDASVGGSMAAPMHPAAVAWPDNLARGASDGIHSMARSFWNYLRDQNGNWVSSGMVLNVFRKQKGNRCGRAVGSRAIYLEIRKY